MMELICLFAAALGLTIGLIEFAASLWALVCD